MYTLSNENGYEVDILTYGARITRIYALDKNGNFPDLIVGCKAVEDYYGPYSYYGATIGRYGNRIEGARLFDFRESGKYRLASWNGLIQMKTADVGCKQ